MVDKKQKRNKTEDQLDACLVSIANKFLSIIPAADRKSFNRIGFHVEAAWWFYTDYCRPVTPGLPNWKFRAFAPVLLSKQAALLAPFGGLGALPRLMDAFYDYRSQIPVCGAAIFDSSRKRVLLVRSLHSASKWSFPRGKMNAHETAAACAVREVWEEVGYDIGPLLKEEMRLEWIRRGQHPIRIYVVVLPEGHEQWAFAPQTMGEIGEIGWHRLEALRKFRTTYYDVNQFERGLRNFAKDQQSILMTETTTQKRSKLVMKKVSLTELFPAPAAPVKDPFSAKVVVEQDDASSLLDPTERVLQIVDELKLTDWLPAPVKETEDTQDLLDLLTMAKPKHLAEHKDNRGERLDAVEEEELMLPRKKTEKASPGEKTEKAPAGDDHRDLISLILFGK